MRFRIRADMEHLGGPFEIVLPHAALEPVREHLLHRFRGAKFGSDSLWAAHLKQQTLLSTVDLEVVLDEQRISLGEVMQLAVGTTLPLHISADTPVILRRGQVPLLRGRMGRVGDRLAIRIEEKFTRADSNGHANASGMNRS